MTSLSQQLKKLAVPQTSGLADLKKRPSILFDHKEAATKDRKTIYDLGCQGLSELISLNKEFSQFEDTLFQQTSLNVERSVEDAAFNEELDKNIKKFFMHLSPYFMLRSSHLCLEWMIRRFQVHEYNKDTFVALILPYHETNIFVKCVQIMKIRNPSDAWNWLEPIQKPGVTLAKSTVINRASVDPSFLKFLCTSVVDATKELDAKASTLQCLINFYCSVVIGAFENCHELKEWHVTTILPSIMKGMKSGVPDFISASFIITSQLVNKTHLNANLLNILITQIWKVKCESLQGTMILLLNWIARTHDEDLKQFPQAGFVPFITNSWLTSTIDNINREGISMLYITLPLIRTAFEIIQNTMTDADACKFFLEKLLFDVQFEGHSAKMVIRCVLEALSISDKKEKGEIKDGEVIDLDDEADTPSDKTIITWFRSIIQLLERQYPSDMDAVIKSAIETGNGEASNAVKVALAYRYKFLNEDTTSVFENLYHSNPTVRRMSVKEIVNHINKNQNDVPYYSLLKEILPDRIKDDNEKVVEEILKLPTNICVEILGHKKFAESIISLLDRATTHPASWKHLQSTALTRLTSDAVVKNYDNNIILLTVIRYLFPVSKEQDNVKYIKVILHSAFANNKPFLKKLSDKFKTQKINTIEFKKEFLEALTHADDMPRVEELIESMKENTEYGLKNVLNMCHFLIMVAACYKTNNEPEKGLKVFDFAMEECSRFKIKLMTNSEVVSDVPLQLFIDFINTLVAGTNFENLQNWETSSAASLELFLNIFDLLMVKAFSTTSETNEEKLEWTKCLRDMLNLLFPTPKQKLALLSQFLFYENICDWPKLTETRVRAARLLEVILRGDTSTKDIDLKFILKAIIALSSPIPTIRECSLDILRAVTIQKNDLKELIKKIVERSEEIQFDDTQIPLILYTILSSKNKSSDCALVKRILAVIADSAESMLFKSKVLEILKHIKSTNIIYTTVPLALKALSHVQTIGNVTILDEAAASIFKSVITRFDENTIQEVVSSMDKSAWQLIENSLKMPKIFARSNDKLIPVPCITLEILDEATYEQLPNTYKSRLLKLIIETISSSDNDTLFLDVNKALKKCNLDCKHVLPLLEAMSNLNGNTTDNQKKKRPSAAKDASTDMNLLNTSQWKEGVILLEILENKKKLVNTHVLIPVLFDILKRCLYMEIQSPVEYTKQLILSALLHCCQITKSENLLSNINETSFKIDLIVQCIQLTQNPQTHYNALLFLSHCAVLFPQQVLHNFVGIFTFMGSSIARQDDAFSFQIISNIVESIIPVVTKDNNSANDNRVVQVLKIFSDILLDVPEHRRKPLYTKLLHTLGAEKYIWMFLCVVFESHVITGSASRKSNQSAPNEKLPKRIEIVLQLLNEFSTNIGIHTCVSLLSYVKRLPMDKDKVETVRKNPSMVVEAADTDLFNAKTRSAKQLRHYIYLILQFVSTFTSSTDFLKAVSVLNEEETNLAKSQYQSFIIKTLSYIPSVTAAIEKSEDPTQSKFWKVILHHCYDSLDNIISLLSPDIFLVVVNGLMIHKLVTIRKKVIELLISKLQQKSAYFEECKEDNILNLLNSLCELVSTIASKERLDSATSSANANETIFVQQAGLIAIKLLSKVFALKYLEQFKNIVEILTTVTKNRTRISKIILTTVILTLVEVASNLKAHSIAHLPKFMPNLVEALEDQTTILQKQQPDNVCLALITGIQKLFEAMPLFLGPYTVGIISALSTIWSRIQNSTVEQEQRRTMNINKLDTIWKKIALEVPARILIPNCEKAYFALMEENNFSSISYLMKLFFECVSKASNSDLASVQVELIDFFLKCLEFRSQMADSTTSSAAEICSTEMEIINAFVAWILKLSESSFRPVYKKVYDWSFQKDGPKERVLTYFILNKCISNSLKSLFVLFSSDFIQDAAELLTACNTSKKKILYFPDSEELNMELLENILSTLTNIFTYDTKGFSNPHRFDLLMQPVVDQLENKIILNSEPLQNVLLSCIGQLAVAVSSDVLWKQLHYQILLKTRANVPEVRIIAFNSCVELARKLGDDFTSLLPETVPFVAELFEDENALVVKNSRKAVQELESILGESLQKYL